MSEFDKRGSGFISGEERGVLTESERSLLSAQHRNRRDAGVLPGALEERRLKNMAVDSRMKTPRHHEAMWVKSLTGNWRRP